VEWGAMRVIARAGAKAPSNTGFHGITNSYGTVSPFDAFDRFFPSGSLPPSGRNWGYYKDPWVDEMIAKAKVTFGQKEQDEILAQVHTKLVDDAVWIWIVKDLNPRALGKKVRGFVPPQSWYVDLTSVYKEK
jgi:ABC-type transport system substrate-binding protein